MARAKMSLSGSRQKISMLNRHYIKNEIFISSKINASLLRKIRLHLPNLTDFELLEDRAIFITPVLVGEPMLESKDLSPTEKVEIIGTYLKIIKEFDELPIFLQVNLIRPENFYIVSGELKHRGVLIVEDIIYDRPLKMRHLLQGISNVIIDFIDNDISLYNFKSYFRDLPSQEDTSYESIEDDVKKIYIKDLFLEDPPYMEKVDKMQKAFLQRLKHVNIKFFIIASFLMVFLIAGALSLFGGINIGRNTDIQPLFTILDRNENILIIDQSYVPPGIHVSEKKWSIFKNGELIKEQNTDLINLLLPEEGNYLIRLELKDSKGVWSPSYEESYTKKYHFEDYDELNYFNFSGAKFDEEIYYTGGKSLVFTNNTKLGIREIYLKDSIIISFALRSSEDTDIDFTLEGYNRGSKIFNNSWEFPAQKDTWITHTLELNSDEIDEIFISPSSDSGLIWLDNIRLSSTIISGFEF